MFFSIFFGYPFVCPAAYRFTQFKNHFRPPVGCPLTEEGPARNPGPRTALANAAPEESSGTTVRALIPGKIIAARNSFYVGRTG